MSDITLSSGIRQNLLSLQQTSADLTTTQEALATGKAVNSASDNPSAFFTSQTLTNNANALSALLDQIGQGSQTISAADNGLTGVTSLLQQALSTATQAQQSATGTLTYSSITGTGTIGADSTQTTSNTFSTTGLTAATLSTTTASDANIAGLSSGNKLVFTIGSTTATATFGASDSGATFADSTGLASYLSTTFGSAATVSDSGGNLSITSNVVGTNVSAVTGTGAAGAAFSAPTTSAAGSQLVLTDAGGAHSTLYYVNSADTSNSEAATNGTFSNLTELVDAINGSSNTSSEITASSVNGGTQLQLANHSGTTGSITVGGDVGSSLGFNTTAYDNNYNSSLATAVNGSQTLTIQVGTDSAHTLTFGTGTGQISTLAGLNTALSGLGDVTATVNGSGNLVLAPTSTSTITVSGSANGTIGLATSTTPNATVVTANSTRATLQTNFNNLLTQINQLASDASYNGVNLLTGNNLTVDFNQAGTSSLTIQGVNDSSTGLGLSQLNNGEFQDDATISSIISNLNNAISSVQAQTETFGTNASTITTRQTFETNLINTLQTGASNLVAADQNQESANLLTEQTQQQLEISALSIANQANQSVLKLFG
jgi:flagellin-like hook-associated protein FlgL